MSTTTIPTANPVSVTPEIMLAYWQDERQQTRQLIEDFPEDHLFFYSLNGMKPFAELVIEIISMTIPAAIGITTGFWQPTGSYNRATNNLRRPLNKNELLALWDETTGEIDRHWANMPEGRILEKQTVFGLGSGPVYSFVLRYIDREIQHRCQAILYLRSLNLS